MSQTIDSKVVEMQFDNEQFQKGVSESMSILDKLKEKLNKTDNSSALDGLKSSLNGIDLSGLYNSISNIESRMSTFGIVGATVISRLTNLALDGISNIFSKMENLIKQGGMSRALNIETAKFQLEGLGVAWEKIYDDIDYAVSGTAYGFDSAARAASQLSASGIEVGDSMKIALRGISGVAAMTNSEYDEIAHIFTTVAGNGRLMTEQLNQMSYRGLNAASTLAKAFGVTEKELRAMVSEGRVDFKNFAMAMDDAFGEHAKDANKTFDGVMRNIRAAFARVGEIFYAPVFQEEGPLVKMLQQVRLQINNMKVALIPLANAWTELIKIVGNYGESVLKNFDMTPFVKAFYYGINTVKNAIQGLLIIFQSIGGAFSEIFPKKSADSIVTITGKIKEFSENLKMSEKHANQFKTLFSGIFSILKLGIDTVKALISTIKNSLGITKGLSDAFFDCAEGIGNFLKNVSDTIRGSELMQNVLGATNVTVKTLSSSIANFVKAITDISPDKLKGFIDSLTVSTSLFETIKIIVNELLSVLGTIISSVLPGIKLIGTSIIDAISGLFDNIKKTIKESDADLAATVFSGGLLAFLTNDLVKAIQEIRNILKEVENITKVDVVKSITKTLDALRGTLYAYQETLKSDYLFTLAKAVLAFTASIILLSNIDTDALGNACVALGMLVGEMLLLIKVMTGSIIKSGSIGKAISNFIDAGSLGVIIGSLVELSGAVLLLSVAITSLSKLDTESLVKGMTAMSIVLWELVAVAKVLSSSGDAKVMKGVSAVILLAGAIDLLSISIKSLGALDTNSLIKGLTAITITLGELMSFCIIMSKALEGNKIIEGAGSLVIFGVAINIIASAIKKLGEVELFDLIKGLGSISILLVEIGVFAKLVKPNNIVEISGSLLVFSIAVSVLGKAVSKLGSMSLDQVIVGLVGLAGILAGVAVFATMMSGVSVQMLALSVALVPFSVAINILASAIATLGNLDFGAAVQGVLAVIAIMGAMTLMSAVAQTMILAIPTLLAMSVTIIAIAGSLALLSACDMEGLTNALKVMAIAIAGFAASMVLLGVVGSIMSVTIPFVLAFAASLGILGAAIALAGVGFAAFGTGLSLVAASLYAATLSFVESVKLINKNAEKLKTGIANIITGLVQVISATLPMILDAILAAIDSLLAAIESHVPSITEKILSILGKMLTTVSKWLANTLPSLATNLVDALFKMAVGLVNGLADALYANVGILIEATNRLLYSVVYAIGAWVGNFSNAGSIIIEAFSQGFQSQANGPAKAIVTMLTNALNKIKSKVSEFVNAGKSLIQGFINGIKGLMGSAEAAINEEAGKEADKAKEQLKSSGEAAQKEIDKTIKNAKKEADKGVKEAKSTGKKVGNSFSGEVAKAGEKAAKSTKKNNDDIKKSNDEAAKSTKGLGDTFAKVGDIGAEYLNQNGTIFEETAASEQKATEHNYDFADSCDEAGKASGGSGGAAEKVKDYGDAFEYFSSKVSKTTSSMINNITSQIKGTVDWARDMVKIKNKGYSAEILEMINGLDKSSYEEVHAFANATVEQVRGLNALYGTYIGISDMTADEIVSTFVNTDDRIQNEIENTWGVIDEELRSSIESSIDLFGEFEKKTEHSAGEVLANMRSQIEGVTDWANQLKELGARGINEGLLKYLADLGPQGYDYVHAFTTMTQEQLAEANALYTQEMQLDENAAATIGQGFFNAGQYITAGFANGINKEVASTTMKDFGSAGYEAFRNFWGIHSPSVVMSNQALFLGQGFVNGIKLCQPTGVNVMIMFGEAVYKAFKERCSYDKFHQIGQYVVEGLKNGIDAYAPTAIAAAERLADEITRIVQSAFDEHSPSKVFKKIGRYLDEGLAIGINDYAGVAINSADKMSRSVVDMAKSAFISAIENLNNTDDFNPTIKPVLDLSDVQNKSSKIASMLRGSSVSSKLAINASSYSRNSEPIGSTSTTVNNVTFNQTNNSPKSLNRYEIYRQTQNQLSSLKGALT